jgi:GMP synthase-like glutamine amidotransferase
MSRNARPPLQRRLLYVGQLAEPGYHQQYIAKLQGCAEGANDADWMINRLVENGMLDLLPIDSDGGLPRFKVVPVNVAEGEQLPAITADFDFDAVVVGGTFHSVHDRRPFQLRLQAWLKKLRTSRLPVPLLGICGGHQLLAHMFGGSVEKRPPGHRQGTIRVTLTTAGHNNVLFQPPATNWSFHFGNSEHVISVPAPASILAETADSPAVAIDFGKGWFGTQFHPEVASCTFQAICEEPQRFSKLKDSALLLLRNFLVSACQQREQAHAQQSVLPHQASRQSQSCIGAAGRDLFFKALGAKCKTPARHQGRGNNII